jgi:hypothetical protein
MVSIFQNLGLQIIQFMFNFQRKPGLTTLGFRCQKSAIRGQPIDDIKEKRQRWEKGINR